MGVTIKELEFEVCEKPCVISPSCVYQVKVGEGFALAAHLSLVEFPLVNSKATFLLGLIIFGASERRKTVETKIYSRVNTSRA